LSADAAHLLLTYPWPGNVRELDNVMQRALILANGPVVQAEHVQMEGVGPASASMGQHPGKAFRSEIEASAARFAQGARAALDSVKSAGGDYPDRSAWLTADGASSEPRALSISLSAAECDLILQALRSDNGNRQLAAKRLGISARTLRYKLAKLREAGIEVPAPAA
jgi:two-component system response regulator FlrC